VKLPEETARISEANQLYLHGGKKKPNGPEGSRTSPSEITSNLDELVALTNWKKL
jgi:hypothetical protein